jgi:hypothetical protein
MRTPLTYEQQVWTNAVNEAEQDLIRACPTLRGGQRDNETPEDYADRGIAAIEHCRARLTEARAQLGIALHKRSEGGRDKCA